MWNNFKNFIKNMTTYVPTKQTKDRYNHPWMNTQLRKISNSEHTPRLKSTKNTKDWKLDNFSRQSYRKNPGLLMENTWKISAQNTRSKENAFGKTNT